MADIGFEGGDNVNIVSGDDKDRVAVVNRFSELKVAPTSFPHISDAFDSATISAERWEQTTATGGTISLAKNEVTLATTTSSGSEAEMNSTQSVILSVTRNASIFLGVKLDQRDLTNNERQWGCENETTDTGYYFELKDGVMSAVIEKDGSATKTNLSAYSYLWDTDNYLFYEIDFNSYVVSFKIFGIEVHAATMSTTNLIYGPDILLHFHNENTGATSAVAKLYTNGVAETHNSGGEVVLYGEDENGLNRKVRVNAAGQLSAVVTEADTPVGQTGVRSVEQHTVAKDGATATDNYVIPDGETFVLQAVEFGAYTTQKANELQIKIEVTWQPNGDATGQELLDVIYLQGQSDFTKTYTGNVYVGDGTARLRFKITNQSGWEAEYTTVMRGYY